MRFELERWNVPYGDEYLYSSHPYIDIAVRVRVNKETTLSLPTTSHAITSSIISNSTFHMSSSWCDAVTTLDNLSQGLQLNLERVGNDYKLALVNSSGEFYYYYGERDSLDVDFNEVNTIDRISQKIIHTFMRMIIPRALQDLNYLKIVGF
ncbi:hypothetical protein GOM44_05745 [Wolbachia endosymbiont of Atemnus politus]|uniref:hypothetical protein n=1 Tax=Wolbachia endosymbiont of Atemnus politus TaxID=2682840 RepID=UPI001574957F|nr:hypothetical protein [Wolbachia endosymbiont of Atemnus politus]NSX83733.1 hypothetical protein [Wolbachia endosymbiont of Atemnus politus]